MTQLEREYKKHIKTQSSLKQKFESTLDKNERKFEFKVNEKLKSVLPSKRINISGVKTYCGDYVIALNSNKVFIRFKRSGLSVDYKISKKNGFLNIIPIEEKIKLIKKLS